MDNALVSILIPAYKPAFFELTLKSAISQSYQNIEIIISDDCPDDAIKTIAEKFINIAPIKYYRNPNPDGSGLNNFINCLQLARGELVKFLYDDDILMPFAVQYMAEVFDNNKDQNLRLVVSERWFIDGDHRYRGKNALEAEGIVDVTEYAGERYHAIALRNSLGEWSTAMWRREDSFNPQGDPVFAFIGEDRIIGLIDVATWINLSKIGRVYYIALPLSCFRRHAQANSSAKSSPWYHTLYTDWELIVDSAFKNGSITREEALKSYEIIGSGYVSSEGEVPSLAGHAGRIQKKIFDFITREFPNRNEPGDVQEPLLDPGTPGAAQEDKFAEVGDLATSSRFCCICEKDIRGFLPYRGGQCPPLMRLLGGIGSDLNNFNCPNCGCHDRERHLFLFFNRLNFWEKFDGADVLHFAPEFHLSRMINSRNVRKYVKADLFSEAPDIEKIDIMAIPYPSDTFDIVMANHVLEHVADDSLALSEIRRVLRPGGIAILQTPYCEVLNMTWSDPGIIAPELRLQVYGQEDHVRLYGSDIFQRFENSGLHSLKMSHEQILGNLDPGKYGINLLEPFFFFEKPMG